jgi:hypothetical protein
MCARKVDAFVRGSRPHERGVLMVTFSLRHRERLMVNNSNNNNNEMGDTCDSDGF